MSDPKNSLFQIVNHILAQHPELIDPAFQLIVNAQKPWRTNGSQLTHSRVFPGASYSPWLDDQEFSSLYEKIRNFTLVDIFRCFELWSLAKQTAYIDGDILEVGVWRGGTGVVIAQAVKSHLTKKVYLADTFSGVVKASEKDTRYTGGEHSDTSPELVRGLLQGFDLKNVEILQGIFPEDTQHLIKSEKIAMLHCDVDVYESSKDIVNWCIPRLSPGAILVFDDYGFSGCEGVTRFCNELAQNPNFRHVHNLNGHAVFFKV